MSDAFADLWASSAPTKSTQQQTQKKVDLSIPPRRQYDAFSILSASQPPSRPVANNQLSDRRIRQPHPVTHGGDAFSDLLPSTLDGTAADRNPDRAMTMAERAVLAQKARAAQSNAAPLIQTEPASSASLWDGLDVLARPSTTSPQPNTPIQGNVSSRDSFGFGFDDAPPSLTGTPGDFDFGDREDGPLDLSQDDLLGDLGKPVSHSHSPSPNPPASIGRPTLPPRTSASPPPHITGQLVEMGFPPADARAALANTMSEDGFDIQAAADLLLSQAGQGGPALPSPQPPERERRRNGDRDTGRDRGVHRPPPSRTESSTQLPRSSQTQPRSQPQFDTTAEKILSQASDIGRGMFSKANALWKEGKERAAKIYEERAVTTNAANGAPASDGRPRWMRDTGDEWQQPDRTDGSDTVQGGFRDDEGEDQGRVQKERQRPSTHRPPLSQSQLPHPRPEREREIDFFSADSPTVAYQSPFRRGKPKSQISSPSIPSAPTISTQTPTPTLLDPPTSQQPPQPPRTFTTTIASSALTTSTVHKSAATDAYKRGDFPVALAAYMRALSALPQQHVLRIPILTSVALVRSKMGELRETIKACEEAVAIVRRFVGDTCRDGGNGGEAETSFAGAELDFNESAPVEVGTGKVSVSMQGNGGAAPSGLPASVDLAEGLSKAFRRRAEALEGLEKWDTARITWEALLGAGWAGAGARGEAIKGIGRCRRMADGGEADEGGFRSQTGPSKPKPQIDSTPRPRPRPTPKSPADPPPSAALTAFRSAHDVQQTEDAARLACKDAVDARLAAWKAGREGNIRALLTSLDENVLWPELGWRKVGMAEVVSKGQVKGAYVRAIAKVHPDKLNAGNTTVEQRMVANGVFGALNEAWNAFQQQQQ